mmetsp:Transcript_4064/g.11510  ORF Transcript_4064/g.11510 Transcript_4064/m.11510 type:complete len:235 (-) Transcript_4064:3071-3775(-)
MRFRWLLNTILLCPFIKDLLKLDIMLVRDLLALHPILRPVEDIADRNIRFRDRCPSGILDSWQSQVQLFGDRCPRLVFQPGNIDHDALQTQNGPKLFEWFVDTGHVLRHTRGVHRVLVLEQVVDFDRAQFGVIQQVRLSGLEAVGAPSVVSTAEVLGIVGVIGVIVRTAAATQGIVDIDSHRSGFSRPSALVVGKLSLVVLILVVVEHLVDFAAQKAAAYVCGSSTRKLLSFLP